MVRFCKDIVQPVFECIVK